MCSKIISSLCKIKWFWLTFKNVHSFDVAFLHLLAVVFPPFSWGFIGNPVDWKKSYPTAKIYSFPPSEKPVVFLVTYLILGERKVSLMALRQVLPKVLSAACFFSYTIMTYLKKLDGTMSLDIIQCLAGIFSSVIPKVSPFLEKIFPPLMSLYWTQAVWTVPLSPEAIW